SNRKPSPKGFSQMLSSAMPRRPSGDNPDPGTFSGRGTAFFPPLSCCCLPPAPPQASLFPSQTQPNSPGIAPDYSAGFRAVLGFFVKFWPRFFAVASSFPGGVDPRQRLDPPPALLRSQDDLAAAPGADHLGHGGEQGDGEQEGPLPAPALVDGDA